MGVDCKACASAGPPPAALLGVLGCEVGVLWPACGCWLRVLVLLPPLLLLRWCMWAVAKAITADSADTAWGASGPCAHAHAHPHTQPKHSEALYAQGYAYTYMCVFRVCAFVYILRVYVYCMGLCVRVFVFAHVQPRESGDCVAAW